MPRKPTPKPIRIVKVENEYQTFAMMLRPWGEHRHLTARELMGEFKMSYPSITSREENPSLLTIADVYRLAQMRKQSVNVVLGHLIREIQDLPPELHPLTEPGRQSGVGRPRLPRKPGQVSKKQPRKVSSPEEPPQRAAKRVAKASTAEQSAGLPPDPKKPKKVRARRKPLSPDKLIDKRRRKRT